VHSCTLFAPLSSIRAVVRCAAIQDLTAFTRVRSGCFRSEYQGEHGCLRRMFCGRDRLRVNIQRRSQRGMAQQLLHHLELCPYAPQQSRVRVPESMPSESFLDSNILRDGANVFAQDCLTPYGLSAAVTAACKNPIVRFVVAADFSPFRQHIPDCGMNRHRLL